MIWHCLWLVPALILFSCTPDDKANAQGVDSNDTFVPLKNVSSFSPAAQPLAIDFDLLLALQHQDTEDILGFLDQRELTCQAAFDSVKWFDLRSRVIFRDQDIRPKEPLGQHRLMQACASRLNFDGYDRAYWRMRWCTETDAFWFCPLDIRHQPEVFGDRWMNDNAFDAWWVALMRHDRSTAIDQLKRGREPGEGWTEGNVEGFLARTADVRYQQLNSIFLAEARQVMSIAKSQRLWEQPWGKLRQIEQVFAQQPQEARHAIRVMADRAEASSVWQNGGADDPDYGPDKLLDRDPRGQTAWAPAQTDRKPSISLFYDKPVALNKLEIVAGLSENSDHGYGGRQGYPVEVLVTFHRTDGSTESMSWWLGLPIGWELIGRRHTLYPFLRNSATVQGVIQVDIRIFLYWRGSKSEQIPIADVLLYELETPTSELEE